VLDFAIDLARQAGHLLRSFYAQGPNQVSSKQSSVDLVTEADLASEQLIVTALRDHFPGHRLVTEEGNATLALSGPEWVVDPLDGTTNFAHGYPIFAVTLAFLQDGTVEFGVTYDPLRDELFWAARGQGAWCNGRQLRVSTTDTLGNSLLATGFQYDRASNPDNNLAEFSYFMPRTRGVRRSGAAALEMAWVAASRLDGYWEKGLHAWDLAAGALLVEEAGGRATTYAGRPWLPETRNIVVCNGAPALQEALLAGLRTARHGLPLPD
jgi:myo-inositol-1(or 4)-monophosphatase